MNLLQVGKNVECRHYLHNHIYFDRNDVLHV